MNGDEHLRILAGGVLYFLQKEIMFWWCIFVYDCLFGGLVARATAEQEHFVQCVLGRIKCYWVFYQNFLVAVAESGFVPGWMLEIHPLLHGT